LLWRGTANDTVHPDPEKVETQIHESVEELFTKFPPPGN
jgi:hypothetical protein